MEFCCFHRDRLGSLPLRLAMVEEHWSYMDGFGDRMIARGPTFSGDTLTGSVHLLSLPDPAAARAFAHQEPGYQAGAYRDLLLRRWSNQLGRTMWDFPDGGADATRYLVLGLGPTTTGSPAPAPDDERLIAYGPLLSDDGEQHLGTLVLIQAPDEDAARAVLPYAHEHVEVHRWRFGGRPA